MATFVLVHGGWDGGWAWREVARKLESAGHEVFRPTLTGCGERVHLANPDIDLDTHVSDIVNVMAYEQLNDVVLVGFSYGGAVATGVAEQVPERIKQVIFLDALVPDDGESAADLLGPELSAWFREQARILGDGWRLPHFPPDADRRTDLLMKPCFQPLQVKNPAARHLNHTYVLFTDKAQGDPLGQVMARVAERAQAKGWHYRELATGHFPQLDKPQEVARLLMESLQTPNLS